MSLTFWMLSNLILKNATLYKLTDYTAKQFSQSVSQCQSINQLVNTGMCENENCNHTRFMIKWANVNQFKRNLQEIMLNI